MKKIVFIWPSRCAGTSIYYAINAVKLKTLEHIQEYLDSAEIVTFGHMDYYTLLQEGYISEEFDENAYKFAFVRDPYDRAVSLYLHYLDKSDYKVTFLKNKTFLEFLTYVHEHGCRPLGLYNNDNKLLSSANPQVRWTENVPLDFVGHVESIESDIKKLADTVLNRNIKVRDLNATKRQSIDYYADKSCVDLVNTIYEEDFEAFGYKMGNLGNVRGSQGS